MDTESSNCRETHFWSALLLINCNWGLIEYEETVILFYPVWPNSPGHFLPETGISFLNHQQNAFSLLRKSSWTVSWNTSHLLSKMECSTQGKHWKVDQHFKQGFSSRSSANQCRLFDYFSNLLCKCYPEVLWHHWWQDSSQPCLPLSSHSKHLCTGFFCHANIDETNQE